MSSEEERPSAPLPPETCRVLLEEAPVGVCIVQERRIVHANRWLRAACGRPSDADYPLDVLAVIHPDDRELVIWQLQQRLAGQEADPIGTVRLADRAGAVREVECHDRRIEYRGRPAVQLTLVDVSARAAAERALQERAARLEESSRLRLLFADILSHDLMNPVWIAENYLRLVTDEGVPPPKRAFYEGMRGSLVKARTILADVRTYLKLQDCVAPPREPVDLGQVAEAVARELEPQSAAKGQRITVSAAGGAVISASPLVREAVWQLLANAVKYGPQDSAITVSVSAGPRVRLEVRDLGPGVPEEGRLRIFRRFERMEKGPIVGVGLGLSIVRRIVELHGGTVRVEEHPDGGSVFVAEFPPGD